MLLGNLIKKILLKIDSLVSMGLILSIQIYQKILSPDHSFWAKNQTPYCRFFPTCSMYSKEAIEKHGTIKGGLLGIKRICRCHPWAKGGLDLVPEKTCKNCSFDKTST